MKDNVFFCRSNIDNKYYSIIVEINFEFIGVVKTTKIQQEEEKMDEGREVCT